MLKLIILSLLISLSAVAQDAEQIDAESVNLLNKLNEEVDITSLIIDSCHEFKLQALNPNISFLKSPQKKKEVCDDYAWSAPIQ